MKDKEKAVYLRPFYRTHQGALYPLLYTSNQ